MAATHYPPPTHPPVSTMPPERVTTADLLGVDVGDVFVCSWGYNQTNVNWFEVVRITRRGVELAAIRGATVPASEGFMSSRVVAATGADRFDVHHAPVVMDGKHRKVCKIKAGWRDGATAVLSRNYNAHKWDGRPTYCSWYA